MKRFFGPAFIGFLLLAVGHARAGWPAGIFAGLCAFILTLFMGSLVRGRALKQAPAAPPLLAGETPLLHGPVSFSAGGPAVEGWAYLSDQRLTLLASDETDGATIRLKEVEELRPAKRGWRSGGELGVVAAGRLWRLKVPDSARWLALLQSASRAKA
jgi:hypothetical protein